MIIRRVGFVIDGRVPGVPGLASEHCGWTGLLRGCPSSSSIGLMRFTWLAAKIPFQSGMVYELYRPWRQYKAVIFLKSMSQPCQGLARSLQKKGTRVVFDANVDYFTSPVGTFYYEGMEPTAEQQRQAIAMAENCDAVISDSEHIASKAAGLNRRVAWIPDNVNMDIVPSWDGDAAICSNGKLKLLWSGEAVKLFDLLAIEGMLRAMANRITLILVTGDLRAVDRWYPPYRERFMALLEDLAVRIVPFRSIEDLLEIYRQGGIFISPRFLDNSYNLGHTEWKITLPMACEVPVLCSPQPSYRTVARRGGGVRICHTEEDWLEALEGYLSHVVDWREEGRLGRQTVVSHYSTEVIARQHLGFVSSLLEN